MFQCPCFFRSSDAAVSAADGPYCATVSAAADPLLRDNKVTARDMEDTYLPAFAVGVQKGKASGIMCSYNDETFGKGDFGR